MNRMLMREARTENKEVEIQISWIYFQWSSSSEKV